MFKRVMFRRWMQGAVVCVLAVVMLGASPESRYNKVGHEMMCACGCGQILLECNHLGCPDSARMIKELHVQIDSGASNITIMNWFAAKYGAVVLASPIRGGFDRVAWIAPIALFLLATLGTGVLIWVWKRRPGSRAPADPASGIAGGDAMRERIRRETEY